jgi:hypothetical protein
MGGIHGDNDKLLSGCGIVPGMHRLVGRVCPEPFPEHIKGRKIGKPSAHGRFNILPFESFYNKEKFS